MAVADLGVEMGPRIRRRLGKGAIGLGVSGAIVAAVFLLNRPPSSSGPGSSLAGSSGNSGSAASAAGRPSRPATPASLHPVTQGLAFGMTKQQVLRIDGRPAKILRDWEGLTCWQYAVNQTFGRHTLNAVRVCFAEGVYNVYHFQFDGKWDY